MSVYAIIHTGGKQYRVSPGDVIRVEKLTAQPGDTIELDQVYLLADAGRITVGNPVLKNARVVTEVLDQNRGNKIIIFKHRRRKGNRKTTGHRQCFTELKILEVIHEGAGCQEQPEKQRQSQKQPVVAAVAVADKAGAAKQQATVRRISESPSDRETKQEKQITGKAPAPRKPEEPKHEEQRIAPENTPTALAGARPSVVPATPSREPEKPDPPAQVAAEQPRNIAQDENSSSGKRRLWWIIGVVVAALALLGVVSFIASNRLWSRPESRQATGSKPAPEKQSKTKLRVRDVKTKETVRVDKPTAPAQPPD